MRTSDIAFRHDEGHHVLQLIAETVGSTRLIEGGASPYPTGKRLVEQPAIHQNIHRPVRRGDLYGAEHLVPLPSDISQDLIKVCRAIATDQFTRVFPPFPLTQKKHDFGAFTGTQLKQRLHRRARIKTRTHSSGKRPASLKCRRPRNHSISTDKFGAVTGPRSLPSAEINKGNSPTELSTPSASREQRSRLRIEFRDNVRRCSAARIPQHPFRKCGHGQATGTPRIVLQNETGDLNGVLNGHKLEQLCQNSLRAILE